MLIVYYILLHVNCVLYIITFTHTCTLNVLQPPALMSFYEDIKK